MASRNYRIMVRVGLEVYKLGTCVIFYIRLYREKESRILLCTFVLYHARSDSKMWFTCKALAILLFPVPVYLSTVLQPLMLVIIPPTTFTVVYLVLVLIFYCTVVVLKYGCVLRYYYYGLHGSTWAYTTSSTVILPSSGVLSCMKKPIYQPFLKQINETNSQNPAMRMYKLFNQ
jgi:hypothetical protein